MIPVIWDFSQQGSIDTTTSVCEPFPMTEDLCHQQEEIFFFSTLLTAKVVLTTF